jgi:hypothetical protein
MNTFSTTTITNNLFQRKIAVNTTRCTNWFTTNRSRHILPSYRICTHTPKPNKPVDPKLANSQQLQVHELTPKTASVVPPEDGHLMPETCRGFNTPQSDCESESVLSWLRYCDA